MKLDERSEATQSPQTTEEAHEEELENSTPGASAAPTGLDLDPKPQGIVQVRRSIGIAAIVLGAVFLIVIVVGIMKHPNGAHQSAKSPFEKERVTSAGQAGQQESARLQRQAEERRAQRERAAGGSRSSPTGDVSDDLGDVPDIEHRGDKAAAAAAANNPNAPRPLTPAEIRRLQAEAAYHEEQAAMTAPMATNGNTAALQQTGGGGGSASAPGGNPSDVMRAETAALDRLGRNANDPATLSSSGSGGYGGPGAGSMSSDRRERSDDPNGQEQKAAFLRQARTEQTEKYLASPEMPPVSPYEVKAGWNIPAELDQGLNSDLPGDVVAHVRENVYDSATGRYLLIPQGARLIGRYDSHISFGQNSLEVVWTRLIYPTGESRDLAGMAGQDVQGQSGFRDRVDNHFKRLIAFALLTSGFSAGIQLSQNQNPAGFGYPTNSQIVTQSLGQQMGELGIGVFQRNLNRQPTIIARVGYRFNVRVDRDIVFDQPYVPAKG